MNSLKVALFLAFNSIKAGNRGIILLTVIILAIVTLNMLFVPGLLDGLVSGADEQVKDTYASDIVVEANNDTHLIRDVDGFIEKVEAVNGVIAAAPRNGLNAQLSFEDEETSCTVYGVQPEQEKLAFSIDDSIIEGSYLESNDDEEILLGVQLAGADRSDIEMYSRSLQLVHAGDKITVAYANGVEKRYTVKGIFYSEYIQTDLQAFVTEKAFLTVRPEVKNQASAIHIKIAENANAAYIADQIASLRKDIEVHNWKEYAGLVRSMTVSFNVINTILDVVNIMIAGVTVFIVTYIDVANRKRQIGIQRAIGITNSSITLAYLMRAVFYAIIGAFVACLAFVFLVIPLEAQYPFHFPFGDVYLSAELGKMTRAGIILLVVAVLAAFLPVRSVTRMKILDAIWG
jgi:putative ABC transport system permease protein